MSSPTDPRGRDGPVRRTRRGRVCYAEHVVASWALGALSVIGLWLVLAARQRRRAFDRMLQAAQTSASDASSNFDSALDRLIADARMLLVLTEDVEPLEISMVATDAFDPNQVGSPVPIAGQLDDFEDERGPAARARIRNELYEWALAATRCRARDTCTYREGARARPPELLDALERHGREVLSALEGGRHGRIQSALTSLVSTAETLDAPA